MVTVSDTGYYCIGHYSFIPSRGLLHSSEVFFYCLYVDLRMPCPGHSVFVLPQSPSQPDFDVVPLSVVEVERDEGTGVKLLGS